MSANEKTKPTVIGFKPTQEDWEMVSELMAHYQKAIFIPGVKMSASDVLRTAVKNLHQQKVKKG